MRDNICRFLPNDENLNDINILNFVYETKKQTYTGLKYETMYKVHLVMKGTGRFYVLGNTYDLKSGDVFFTFPTMSYAIESGTDFEYMYISYLGLRINKLMDKLNINPKNFLFRNFNELIPFWKKSIIDNNSILNLRCEGILLYTFSLLGEQVLIRQKEDSDTILLIKKYIDENFSDKTLSLEMISAEFSYNPKYISTVFKKNFHVGISQYITTLRVQQACTLMEQGFTSVKDIAFQCGFSQPFYFSKVFKTKMGISPKEYMHSSFTP